MLLLPTMTLAPRPAFNNVIYPRRRLGRTIVSDLDITFDDIFRIMNGFTDEVGLSHHISLC